MVKLDGSYLEGGGQIVRTALALSTIRQKAFEISDIRKGRPQPGLKNQHLFCMKALNELCNSQAEGAELCSTYLKFYPGKIKPQTLSIDIGTAGSISLLLQALLPPLIFSGKTRLKITGGTDTKWAMPFDYLNNVFLPQMRRYADISCTLTQRGYYPKGGGKVDIKFKSKFSLETLKEAPKIYSIEQGSLIQIKGVSHAHVDLQKAQVAERQAKAAKLILSKLNCPIQIRVEYSNTFSIGSGITLWAIFSKDTEDLDFENPIILGADSLGEKTKRSEEVGKEAADRLLTEIESKAPIDSNLADNLIPFLALFGGKIKVSTITNHTLTNIYACEQFLGKIFTVDKENNIMEVK